MADLFNIKRVYDLTNPDANNNINNIDDVAEKSGQIIFTESGSLYMDFPPSAGRNLDRRVKISDIVIVENVSDITDIKPDNHNEINNSKYARLANKIYIVKNENYKLYIYDPNENAAIVLKSRVDNIDDYIFYYVKRKRSELSSIDNTDNKKVGALAYVIEDDKLYQLKRAPNSNKVDWIEFKTGVDIDINSLPKGNDNYIIVDNMNELHEKGYNTNDNVGKLAYVKDIDKLIQLKIINGFLEWKEFDSGNYIIFEDNNDMGDYPTTNIKLGTLAYVQAKDEMWQFKNDNGIRRWVEFKTGGGGISGEVKATLSIGNVDSKRNDTSGFIIPVILTKCGTGKLNLVYQFNNYNVITDFIVIPSSGQYFINVSNLSSYNNGSIDTSGVLKVTISFIPDTEFVTPPENINLKFYYGDSILLSHQIENFNNINYLINDIKYKRLNGETINNKLKFSINEKYRLNTILDENELGSYKLYYELYKNNKLITEFSSNELSIYNSYNNISEEIEIDETPGIYKLKVQAKTLNINNLLLSNVFDYNFIIDSNQPKILLLDDTLNELSKDITVTTDIYNINCILLDSNDHENSFQFDIIPVINNVYLNDNKINVPNSNIYNLITISINCSEFDTNNTYDFYVESNYNDLKSSAHNLYIKNTSSFKIDKDKLLFNLAASDINNILSDKWISNLSDKKYNDYYKNCASIYNFSFNSTNGFLNENGDVEYKALVSNGLNTYGRININPLYNNEMYNVDDGFTFQIKYKPMEYFSKNSIVECLDNNGRGFIINEDIILFNPFTSIYEKADDKFSAYSNDTLFINTMPNEWYDVSFVVSKLSNESDPYHLYSFKAYNTTNINDEYYDRVYIALIYVNGVLTKFKYFINTDTEENKPKKIFLNSEDNNDYNYINLFCNYNYDTDNPTSFTSSKIRNVRLYNKALSSNEILLNYITTEHSSKKDHLYKINNCQEVIDSSTNEKYYNALFGQGSNSQLPILTIKNANLSATDVIIGTAAKEYVYPNATLELKYPNGTFLKRYGCQVKVQGTSSCNYPIKNYKITFYNITDENKTDFNYNNENDIVDSNLIFKHKPKPNEPIKDLKDIAIDNNKSSDNISYFNSITAFHEDDFERYKNYNNFDIKKEKISINNWREEHTYTLKVDFMESSHVRNTGTAKYINDYMNIIPPQNKTDDNPYKDDPEINKIRHSIDGFPVILNFEYTDNDGNTKKVEQGIYNFNVDKNANNIFGYEEYENKCKSYELSNNGNLDEASQRAALFNLDFDSEENLKKAYESIQQCFEIRYHHYEDDGALNENDKLNFKTLEHHGELVHLLMWIKDCEGNLDKFKAEFENHFNKENVFRYLILVKTLGMVDNLAKNMMVTTWNANNENVVYNDPGNITSGINYEESEFCKWYLQFYDLDTMIGLSNSGENIIKPSISIKGHDFSNANATGSSFTTDTLNLATGSNNLPSLLDVESGVYNASQSLLWTLICDCFDNKDFVPEAGESIVPVKKLYHDLRGTGLLSVDKIYEYYNNNYIDNIGQYYYNLDMLKKYFGGLYASPTAHTATDRTYCCFGNNSSHIKYWISKQIDYLDSVYIYPLNSNKVALRPYNAGIGDAQEFYVRTKSPSYVVLQTADDTNALKRLCSGKYENKVKCTMGNDGNVTFYLVDKIVELNSLSSYGFISLPLQDFENLIKLDVANCNTLTTLSLNSKKLKELNISNTLISSLDLSNLKELISFNAYNTSLSTITINDECAIEKLDIGLSQVSNYNFEKLNNLSSLGTISFTDTAWNSYTKLINNLKQYKLITNDPFSTSSNYTDKSNDEIYLNNLLLNIKDQLNDYDLLTTFNNLITSTDSVKDQLTKFLNNTNLKSKIGRFFIPNLAIATKLNKSIDTIKISSPNIKAIVFKSDQPNNKFFGTTTGEGIYIKCDNLKYLEIDGVNVNSNQNIDIITPNLETLIFDNFKYLNVLNLTELNKLKKISIKNSTISGVKINDTINTINIINFYNSKEMKCFKRESNLENNDYFDFSGLTLNILNIYNVYKFTSIKNLNLIVSSYAKGSDYKNSSDITNFRYYLTKSTDNGGRDISDALTFDCPINGTITLSNITDISQLFYSRRNWIFNFGTNNGLLLSDGKYTNSNKKYLSSITSLESTFALCQNIINTDVEWVMGNISNKLTSLSHTFDYCNKLNLTTNFLNNVFTNNNNIVNVTTINSMFANTYRYRLYAYNNLSGKTEFKSGCNESSRITLPKGIFDKLTKCTDIRYIFTDNGTDFDGAWGNNIYGDCLFRNRFENSSDFGNISTSGVYGWYSYVGKFHIDIFKNMHALNNIGCLIHDLVLTNNDVIDGKVTKTDHQWVGPGNIFTSISPIYVDFTDAINKNINQLFIRRNSEDEILTSNVSSINDFTGLFACCEGFKNSNNKEELVITHEIINNTIINASSNLILDYMFFRSNVKLSIGQFFTKLNKKYKISCIGMFESYKQPLQIFGNYFKLKGDYNETNLIINSYKMFANTNLSGSLYDINTTWDGDLNTIDNYLKTDTHIFSKVNSNLQDISLMFYNCNNFDFEYPNTFFNELKNIRWAIGTFYGCSKMTLELNSMKYLFPENSKMRVCSYLFYGCSGISGQFDINENNIIGSKNLDVDLIYFDIKNYVYHWLMLNISDKSTTTNAFGHLINVRNSFINGLFNNEIIDENLKDSLLDDNLDVNDNNFYNICKTIVDESTSNINYNSLINWSNFINNFGEDIVTYKDADEKIYLYQYYKDLNINHALYNLSDEISNNVIKIYENILQPGLLGYATKLLNVKYLFSECSNIKGPIPANIFRLGYEKIVDSNNNLQYNIKDSSIKNISYMFKNCHNIGYDDILYKPQVENNGGCNPIYCVPYTIFDDLISLTNSSGFLYNVKYLSKPFYNEYNRGSSPAHTTKWTYNEGNNIYATYEIYNENYCLPKNLFKYNKNLTTTKEMFMQMDNNNFALFGIINPYIFKYNINLLDMSYMFTRTNVVGSVTNNNNADYNKNKYFIDEKLFNKLNYLTNISYIFYNCYGMKYLVDNDVTLNSIQTNRLPFNEAYHSSSLDVTNFIGKNTNAYKNTFEDNIYKGRIVKRNTSSSNDISTCSTFDAYFGENLINQ